MHLLLRGCMNIKTYDHDALPADQAGNTIPLTVLLIQSIACTEKSLNMTTDIPAWIYVSTDPARDKPNIRHMIQILQRILFFSIQSDPAIEARCVALRQAVSRLHSSSGIQRNDTPADPKPEHPICAISAHPSIG